MATVTIGKRFRGPPDSGNGGYSCGVFAGPVEGPAQVTLRRPIPLEAPISLEPAGAGWRAADGDGVIAEVEAAGHLEGLEPPRRPTVAEARAAGEGSPFAATDRDFFRGCFVCGPDNEEGLGIYAGALDADAGVYADAFSFPRADAGPGGRAPDELVWAALDCPSCLPSFWGDTPMVLGRLTAELLGGAPVGEELVAVSWELGHAGRKLESATAILGPGGETLARSRAVWIRLRGRAGD